MKIVVRNDKELFKVMHDLFNDFQNRRNKLFQVDVTSDTLSEIYNKYASKTPIFRKRPQWDCSICRHAIRNIARIVAIDEHFQKVPFLEFVLSKIDLTVNYPFLHDMFTEFVSLTREKPIKGLFYSKEPQIGTDSNVENETGLIFDHFYFSVQEKYQDYIDLNDRYNSLRAAITKYHEHISILKDAIFYIEEGYLYRGNEKIGVVTEILKLLQQYNTDIDIDNFVWRNIDTSAAFFNNDVISTLVDDLINGDSVENAIKKYNERVAPHNYRQPTTTIVSPTQIKQCEVELKRLGYDNFIEGFAFATPQDITILDILWTNRKVTTKGTLTDLLKDNIKSPPVRDENMTTISFNEFLNTLKIAKSVEINISNLQKVVLIKDTFDEPVYNWNNHISFCYETGLADMDEVSRKVKEAGGNIDAQIRFSLYWENLDDLDLHLVRNDDLHIYYSHKQDPKTSFQLDIDMNVSNPIRGAVENIFARKIDPKDYNYNYMVFVHNFEKREKPERCVLNMYINNKLVKTFQFTNPRDNNSIELVKFRINDNGQIEFIWVNDQYEKDVELPTRFIEIDTILLSPNYWYANRGNKHIFFLKKGESIDLANIRPYNIEQLRSELVKHRKVLQLLSNKIEIKGKPELVGYGISFGKKREVLLKINGRPYRLTIDPTEEIKKEEIEQHCERAVA